MTISNHDLQHQYSRIMQRLVSIHASILSMEENMSAQLDQLRTEVEESKGVTESAVALITGLAEQIRANKDDPAQLEALAQQLDAQTTALAGAVEANQAPEPAPPPA